MATTTCTAIQPCARFFAEVGDNIRQNKGPGASTPALLQLPPEMLNKIIGFLANEQNVVKAAKNLILFGRVCAHTYLRVCAFPSLKDIIKGAVNILKSSMWKENPEDYYSEILIDGSGKVLSTRPKKCFFM